MKENISKQILPDNGKWSGEAACCLLLLPPASCLSPAGRCLLIAFSRSRTLLLFWSGRLLTGLETWTGELVRFDALSSVSVSEVKLFEAAPCKLLLLLLLLPRPATADWAEEPVWGLTIEGEGMLGRGVLVDEVWCGVVERGWDDSAGDLSLAWVASKDV